MVTKLALVFLLVAATVEIPRFGPVIWEDSDRKSIPEPSDRQVAEVWDFVTQTFIYPGAQLFDLPRNFRKLLRKPKEAQNTNNLDEVPNSSWFTNRNFLFPMSHGRIEKGPDQSAGPEQKGKWTITSCKTAGVTPGMRIKDSKGDTYLLKFDPPELPEMATAADVIGAKFLYAAGYNVPENYITYFDRDILAANPELTCNIDELLKKVAVSPDERLRAVASKFLSGKPKGPFSYLGVRPDDPNDKIDHEHRRELRGLRVIASFINHTDVKDLNTLDTYVEENGRKFLKHHLIDFGASLGSASVRTKNAMHGHEYHFDTGEVMKSGLSLGIYRRPGECPARVLYPSIGYIEGFELEPQNWKPNYPVAAFENLTDRDAYWSAKIVAAFTDEQIAAAVDSGQYSNPEARRFLIDKLIQRRNRIADYWFRRVAPLDRFEVDARGLRFDDLAVLSGRDKAGNVRYRLEVRSEYASEVPTEFRPGAPVQILLTDSPVEARITRFSPGWPEQSVLVYLARVEGIPTVVGIRR